MIPYFILDTIHIGPLILHTWGLFAGLAFAAALFIALKEAKRKNIKEENILDLAVLILFGGVVGARSAFVLENWNYFSQHQAEILSFKEGGLMFFGGAVGAIFLAGAYIYYINRKLARSGQEKISLIRIADILVPSFAIGEFIGRIGCALSDLHIGSITTLPWAQAYIDGSARHPISIYMSLNGLAMFIAFWFLRTKIKIEGALFMLFVLWYSGTRFFLDFFRCDDLNICDPRYSGYTPSQYISGSAFVISLIILILIIRRQTDKKHMSEQQKDNMANKEGVVNENKELQNGTVSYTEIEEVIFESNAGSDAVSGTRSSKVAELKEKLSAMIKKPWAHAAAIIVVLVAGAIGASVYYNSVYYGKMFKNPLFSFQGKTWVSYNDPIVKITVLTDSKCEACNPEQIINYLKSGVASTLTTEEINFDSQKSKDLISKFNINFLPAFIFDSSVIKLKAFEAITPEQLAQTFTEKDGQYYLNPLVVDSLANRMQISLGRFLNPPQVVSGDRVKGSESAPVIIIEFSDFQCPYCKVAAGAVKQVLTAYPDKVRFAFKHFPLPSHANAQAEAEAAECAGDQGKFWEMGDLFFTNQDALTKNTPEQFKVSASRYAVQLKLNKADFDKCISDGKFKSKIEADVKMANDYNIGGTPAFFIGGQLMSIEPTVDNLKAAIEEQLKK